MTSIADPSLTTTDLGVALAIESLSFVLMIKTIHCAYPHFRYFFQKRQLIIITTVKRRATYCWTALIIGLSFLLFHTLASVVGIMVRLLNYRINGSTYFNISRDGSILVSFWASLAIFLGLRIWKLRSLRRQTEGHTEDHNDTLGSRLWLLVLGLVVLLALACLGMQIASIALQYLGGRSLSNAGRRGQEPDALARLFDQTANTFALGGFNLLSLLLNISYWITISFLTSSRLLTSQSVQKPNGLAKNSINLKLLLPLSLAGLVNLLFISLNILNLLIFMSRRILYLSRVIGMLSLKIDAAIFFLVLFPIFRSHIHYHHRDIEEQVAESPDTEANLEESNTLWDRLKLNLGIREEEPPIMEISGPMPIFHPPGISPTNKTNQNMQTQILESNTFGKQFADDELLSRSNRLSTATIERKLQSNFLDFEYWTIQRDTAYSKK